MRRLVCLFSLVMILVSCRQETGYRHAQGSVYGTFYHITYQAGEDLHRDMRAAMEEVNVSLSMFNPNSLLSRLNRNETDTTDILFRKMYAVAAEVFRLTEGGYDITVAPLVNAWGFGTEDRIFPDSARIDSLLDIVGMDRIRLEGVRLRKEKPGILMDVSSIAKGLGVDLVAECLDAHGVENYMVEIGGEIRVKGLSQRNSGWRIGIDSPKDDPQARERNLQQILDLEKGALATSGNYRNFFMHEGKKYAHTINPRTGYPVQTEILGASVYAPTCMQADAFATGFMVVGLDKARKILDECDDLEGFLIYEEGGKLRTWHTEGFGRLFWKGGPEAKED